MNTITLTADADFGHKGQYIARLTGRDSKFTYRREFVGRKVGKRDERTIVEIDDPGLYESCAVGKHGKVPTFYVVFPARSGEELFKCVCESADALKIARALDEGRKFSEIVRETDDAFEILSPAAAKAQTAAATVESAEAQCWAILQALPAPQAKKVLAALKSRLSPPKAATPAEQAPEQAAAE